MLVVPNPTFITFTYSSSIPKISFASIVDIPLKANVVEVVLILPPLPLKEWLTGVNIKGYCTTLSIEINDFSFFFAISNWWAFPSPRPTNVTAVPALVVEIWKLSSF